MAKLQYTDHTGQRGEVPIGPEQPVVVIGRMQDCQIRTVDTSVSRRHTQVTYARVGNEDVFEVSDLESSNGTFVNDQEVKRQRLRPNDRIKCGNFALTFLHTEQPQPMAMPPMMGGGMPGPPRADAPTSMGPAAGNRGGPGLPYLDDPSMALPGMGPPGMGPPGMGMGGPPLPPPPSFGGAPPGGYGPPPEIETYNYRMGQGPSLPPPMSAPPKPTTMTPQGYGDDPMVPSHLSPDQLRMELSRALRRNDALARECDELRSETARLRSGGGQGSGNYDQMRRFEGEAGHLRNELQRLRDENEEMRKEDGRLRAQIDALSDRNAEMKEQFSSLQGSQGDLRDKLREAREDLDNAIFKRDELQSDAERLERDKVELFDQLTKLKIEYNHLERAFEQQKKEHGLLEFEYKRLDEANQELERELRATAEGDNQATDTINKLQTIIDEKEQLIKELRNRIDDFKNQLREQASGEDSWIVEVEKLKKDNTALQSELKEVVRKADVLQRENAAHKAESATGTEALEQQLDELRTELERSQKRLKEQVSSGAFANVSDENAELRLQLEKMREEVQVAQSVAPAGAEELLAQIRELTNENHRLEAKLRETASVTATSPGNVTAVAVPKDKAREVFENMNNMVSGWRANLEAMQIHVTDLSKLFQFITSGLSDQVNDNKRNEIQKALTEADPDWACESMGETVKQILGDSKRIKTMLLELRDQLRD